MSPQEKQALVDAVTKGIAYAENGGKPDIDNLRAGATGEMKSIFQFVPSTWKLYAKQILGDENAPLNPDNELKVVQAKVSKWIDEGRTAGQIASMWNAGEGRPNAYKENWKGVNKEYGVAYDTPAYANKVINYAKQFMEEKQKPSLPNLAQGSTQNSTPAIGQDPKYTYNKPPAQPPVQFRATPLNQLPEIKPLI